MKSKCFIILGMHRSATSLLGKAFHENNVVMGEKIIGPKRGNNFGHWEDKEFVQLNNKILKAAGGKWNKPPSEKNISSIKNFNNEIKNLIENRKKYKMWGFKDPRTVLTIKLYIPFLNDFDLHFIYSFRKPEIVAESLTNRDGSDFEYNLKLAKEYNKRLYSFIIWWMEKYNR